MNKTIEKRITAVYGPIKLKRGRWYIIDRTHIKDGHELFHQCDKKQYYLEMCYYQTMSNYDFRGIKPNWKCECGSIPPASIVAVWCLMEPKKTSEEVQDALKKMDQRPEERIEDELDMFSGWGSVGSLLQSGGK